MKKILLINLFFYSLTILCQEKHIDVAFGPTYKLNPAVPYMSMYGKTNSGFHVLRQSKHGKNRLIEKYDKQLNLVYKEKIILPKRKNLLLNFEGITFLGDQQVVFASCDDFKERKSYAYAYPIDGKGKIGNQFKIIDEKPNEGRKTTSFDFAISKDTSKVLVYFSEPFHKYKDESFSFKVYDNTLTLLWERNVTLPYKDGYFEIGDYKVDNKGNVFILANIYPDITKGEQNSKAKQSVKTILLGFNSKTENITQYELQLPEKWIESITYGFNEKGTEVVIGGYYADNNRMTIKGIFYMSIDIASAKVLKTSIKEFDVDFMGNMIGEKKADKGTGLKNLSFDYFITKKDGGVYLISENSSQKNVGVMVGGGSYFEDIIVVNINSDGNIKWIRKIPKKTYDSKFLGLHLSYAININKENNKLSIIFNDNPKNFELFKKDPNKAIALGEWRYVEVALVTLNEEGEMTRSSLFPLKEIDGFRLAPRFFIDKGNGIYFFATKSSKYKFGELTFK
jgi:hypothetical protein